MMSRVLIALLSMLLCSTSMAQDSKDRAGQRPSGDATVTAISPIFSQLVAFGLPPNFVTQFEKADETKYIREAVPKGETLNAWREMITVTGAKGLAAKVTPMAFLNGIAGAFKNSCPSSFNAQLVSESQISGFDAVIGVVSCGQSTASGGKTSESALFVVIRGKDDIYTVQWAERSSPSDAPIPIDKAVWSARLKTLSPFRVCPIVPGEKAPFPSCVGGQGSQRG
jgi:hypothetical protein